MLRLSHVTDTVSDWQGVGVLFSMEPGWRKPPDLLRFV